MKTELINEVFADFKIPERPFGHVIVSRFHTDGNTSPLGRIYQDLGNGERMLTYISVDSNGEELFPPTEDWCTVENNFERYAKKISQREEEINMLRAIKNNQELTINR